MRNEGQARSLFGISLSNRPRWQQFLICSSGFFFGYLVNGICEVFISLFFFLSVLLESVFLITKKIKNGTWRLMFFLFPFSSILIRRLKDMGFFSLAKYVLYYFFPLKFLGCQTELKKRECYSLLTRVTFCSF